jgi:DNA-binding NarL/FixJ family response regulator
MSTALPDLRSGRAANIRPAHRAPGSSSATAPARAVESKISVYLVAGNRLLREALARILSRKGEFEVCGACPFTPDVSRSIASAGPDLLVLDALSVEVSDCSLLSEISAETARTKIFLIDMDDDTERFLACVRAGVSGYLLQDASAADVISALQAVMRGEAVCPPQLCMPLFQTVARQWTTVPSAQVKMQFGLTRRQQQLVPLIAQGFTNKEIAAHLNLSEQTIKNHIHRMLRRVGASDRLQVIDISRGMGTFP